MVGNNIINERTGRRPSSQQVQDCKQVNVEVQAFPQVSNALGQWGPGSGFEFMVGSGSVDMAGSSSLILEAVSGTLEEKSR